MHTRARAILVVSTIVATGQSLNAQTADLRYRAPLPESITYVTLDTISSTMSGTPLGDITSTTVVRSVNELSFEAVADGFDVTAVLEELTGSVTSPVGDMPITAGDIPAQTIRISTEGPDPEDAAATGMPALEGASPGDFMGWAKAASGLMRLPGRELAPGETWSDTVRFRIAPDGAAEGLNAQNLIITHGTYSGDTVQNGRTLNVLNIRVEMTMTMDGAVSGRAMTQQMTMSTDDRVLWDSVRHFATSRDAVGQTRMEVSIASQGTTMVTIGRTRTITVARPES